MRLFQPHPTGTGHRSAGIFRLVLCFGALATAVTALALIDWPSPSLTGDDVKAQPEDDNTGGDNTGGDNTGGDKKTDSGRANEKETDEKEAIDYRRLRPALFGFAIERRGDNPDHRLVEVTKDKAGKESTRVIADGTLERCESELIRVLEKRFGSGRLNVPFKTFGGAQFWADEVVYCGWRIQRNVYTDHCRLLDAGDTRRSWGSFEQCRVELEKRRISEKLSPKNKKLVVLVHGLFRTKDSFTKLERGLRKNGFDVESINYPSTRRTIREHSDQLARILASLPKYESVSFVTHSLGGIVVRDTLHRKAPWQEHVQLGRLVMIAPPNRGSIVAELLGDWFAFELLAGEAGKELTPEEVAKIPEPTCEFGIIAGGTGEKEGKNGLLPGDNDGTVLVENTKLPSAKDFLLINALHSFVMKNDRAIDATVRFLEEGRFETKEEKGPRQ